MVPLNPQKPSVTLQSLTPEPEPVFKGLNSSSPTPINISFKFLLSEVHIRIVHLTSFSQSVGIPWTVLNHKHLGRGLDCCADLSLSVNLMYLSVPLNLSRENVNSSPTFLHVFVLCSTFNLSI